MTMNAFGLLLSLLVLTTTCQSASSSSSSSSSSSDLSSCWEEETETLTEGYHIQQGICVPEEEAVWYYAIMPGPIASNGLQMGAPTNLHLWFGSIGHSTEVAFDPQNYGLYLEADPAILVVEFSDHFLYNYDNQVQAQPLFTTELATGPANLLFPDPCIIDTESERGQIVCAGWTSELSMDRKSIQLYAPYGLQGQRAEQIGIKFFHLHPVIDDGKAIYNNANGTCFIGGNETTMDDDDTIIHHCRFASDCPNYNNDTHTNDNDDANVEDDVVECIPATEPFEASITVSVYNSKGDIWYKGTRSYVMQMEPEYQIHTVNTLAASNTELIEMIDFQRVAPLTILKNTTKETEETLFSQVAPWAPRFFLFQPNNQATAFPQDGVDTVTITLEDDTTDLPKHGILWKDDTQTEQIGTVELLFEPTNEKDVGKDDGGQIITENLGFIGPGPERFGGTLLAIPLQVGTIPGTYTVVVTMNEGNQAKTHIIVVDENNQSSSSSRTTTTTTILGTFTIVLAWFLTNYC